MLIRQWTLSFFLEIVDLPVIFLSANFFIWAGILMFLFIILPACIISAFKTLKKRQEKARLMEQEIMPKIASQFGKAILASNNTLRFERNKTIFDAKVTRILRTRFNSSQTDYEVWFSLPNLQEKFYIEQKSFFSSNLPPDYQSFPVSSMPKDFIFHSSNPQFLLTLLEKEKIRNEICKYNKEISPQFRIALENGVFVISQNWSSEDSGQEEAEKLEQVCQTAVVFYDELSKTKF
jgi:hypothetical protein